MASEAYRLLMVAAINYSSALQLGLQAEMHISTNNYLLLLAEL